MRLIPLIGDRGAVLTARYPVKHLGLQISTQLQGWVHTAVEIMFTKQVAEALFSPLFIAHTRLQLTQMGAWL